MRSFFSYLFKSILKFFSSRITILFVALVVCITLIWQQLFSIQILHSDDFKYKTGDNTFKEVRIDAARGKIYDRYGRVLADNQTSYDLYFNVKADAEDMNKMIFDFLQIVKKYNSEIDLKQPLPIKYDPDTGFYFIRTYDKNYYEDRFYLFLAEIYGTSYADLTRDQKISTADQVYQYMRDKTYKLDPAYTRDEAMDILWVQYALYTARISGEADVLMCSDISEEFKIYILEHSDDFPGFSVREHYKRIYPTNELFAHIVGYVGLINKTELEANKEEYTDADYIGKTGVELTMESYLRGKNGVLQYEYSGATGKLIASRVISEPVAGDNIYLTIDAETEQLAYDTLYEHIKYLLIAKITGETGANHSTYAASDMMMALINNNFVTPEQIATSNSSYARALYSVYNRYSNKLLNGVRQTILKTGKALKAYFVIYKSIYDIMIDNMISGGRLSTDYRKSSIYARYAAGNFSARTFLEYCLEHGYINTRYYGLGDETRSDYVLDAMLDYEFNELRRTDEYKKTIYSYIFEHGFYTSRNFMMMLYQMKLVTNNDNTITWLRNRWVSTTDVIIDKIKNNELTPANFNLEPCGSSMSVCDPNTGELLALVSYPTYDPNRLNSISYYSKLVQDYSTPMLFRAVEETRAVGSTYKLCVAVAGLDTGVITVDDEIDCKYYYQYVNSVSKPKCNVRGGHGPLTVRDAIKVSCNYFFYEVGRRLCEPKSLYNFTDAIGLEKLKYYAETLGIATKTGIEIPEAEPKASDMDAVRSSIGQGTNAYNIAGINRYTATIANGGTRYDLYLIDRICSSDGELVMKTEPKGTPTGIDVQVFDIVREGMRRMILNKDTSSVLGQYGIYAAGKTGTAQENNRKQDHALMTGYTGYYNETPGIAVSVFIPYGGSSANAIPCFSKFLIAYYDRWGLVDKPTPLDDFKL